MGPVVVLCSRFVVEEREGPVTRLRAREYRLDIFRSDSLKRTEVRGCEEPPEDEDEGCDPRLGGLSEKDSEGLGFCWEGCALRKVAGDECEDGLFHEPFENSFLARKPDGCLFGLALEHAVRRRQLMQASSAGVGSPCALVGASGAVHGVCGPL